MYAYLLYADESAHILHIWCRAESFRKPNNNIQHTIVRKNPIQYNIQQIPNNLLAQQICWDFYTQYIGPIYNKIFENSYNYNVGSNQL